MSNKKNRNKDKVPYIHTTLVNIKHRPTKEIKVGILQQIQNAKNEDELSEILRRTRAFQKASPGTVRKWKKAETEKRVSLSK
jgi:hypothetical protein